MGRQKVQTIGLTIAAISITGLIRSNTLEWSKAAKIGLTIISAGFLGLGLAMIYTPKKVMNIYNTSLDILGMHKAKIKVR